MPAKPRLLVIDDKSSLLKMLSRAFSSHYDIKACSSGNEGLEAGRAESFDVVLTDIRMPDLDGMEILAAVKKEHPETEVVMMTAYAELTQAVNAMKKGAYDYIRKPFDTDELMLTIEKAVERKRLREETSILREQVAQHYGFPSIIGKSPAMEKVFKLARKAANTDTTVLLSGESGTGKEVFARAIHHHSARKSNRFVAINCGAVPKELIESELFGHMRGAFSGATQNKAGLFEEADNGTLFLDEISELNPDLQIKINRAIQEKEIRRLGDIKDRKVDARIIAATNRNLKEAMRDGGFREDLYYRLNVFPIHLPPLREREGDIPLLIKHFMGQIAGKEAEKYTIEPGAMEFMCRYPWPGNVRELRNAIERAIILTENRRITSQLFEITDHQTDGGSPLTADVVHLPYKDAMAKMTTECQQYYVEQLLKRNDGNVTKAAHKAGIERESFHRLMRKLGIRSEEFKN